jgi:Dipeptidase
MTALKSDRSIIKFGMALALLVLLFAIAFPSAYACTEVYVGKDVSEDGSIIVARSNDNQCVWATRVEIVDRVENEPGRTMPVSADGSVTVEIPATTLKYTATPWMTSIQSEIGIGRDAATCSNEYGVSMTMSVTAFTKKAALEADPLVANGLTEAAANEIVICQSKTAREAVEILCATIDEFGSSEVNIATIWDQNEVWYIEMYTGHQYAAVKLPTDMVAVFGNEFNLEYISDYDDAITSEGLESVATGNKFAVYSDNSELNLLETYSREEILADYSHMRTWIGHKLLAPKSYGDYDHEAVYPLVFAPESKVSLKDVFNIMRNRYEGTEYSPDEKGVENVRVIGTDTAMSVHVIQTYTEMPQEISTVVWISLGPDVYGMFVPVSNCSTALDEGYTKDQSTEEGCVFNDEDYAWYNFKEINAIAMTAPETYGAPVKKYWAEAENAVMKSMKELLNNASEDYTSDREKVIDEITEYCCLVQKNAFEDAKTILGSQLWTMCFNSNTMKYGTNPETHEVLNEKRELKPVEFNLDNSKYER